MPQKETEKINKRHIFLTISTLRKYQQKQVIKKHKKAERAKKKRIFVLP